VTSVESDVIRVLADPMRHRIVQLLAQEALCTCHIVEETGATQTNVSNHMRVLREAGLVTVEPRGRFKYYRLNPDTVRAAADALTELAAGASRVLEQDLRRPC
jgi:ArsR family transcriptional regulator, arsenate/arsenite/antimonite-responsive transcriptional repressor